MYNSGALSVDLHAPQIQEYVRSDLSFDNLSSAPVLAEHLAKNHSELLKNLVLVSPDLGGGKRLETFQKALNKRGFHAGIALGHKTRPNDVVNKVEKVVVIGDVEGKDCLITDNIIDTGGTMLKTEIALRERGARSVYAYGTFGLFNNGTEEFGRFDGVMVSDGIYACNLGSVESISLVDLFGGAVYRFYMGESLSDLFN